MDNIIWLVVGALVVLWLSEPEPVPVVAAPTTPTGQIQFSLPGLSGVLGF